MRVTAEQLELRLEGGQVDAVAAVVHRPSRARGAALLLTHGAGGDLDDAGLVALVDAVAARGHLAVRANQAFRQAGRVSPPRAEDAADAYRALLDVARAELGPRRPWAAGGKSYGGRVASLAVAGGMPAAGLVFYSYPLHPAGRPDRPRVAHWPEIPVPCLFLQGDRDRLCDLDVLRANLTKLPRRATVHVVAGGDHSLRIPASRAPDGRAHEPEEVLVGLGELVAGWLDDL